MRTALLCIIILASVFVCTSCSGSSIPKEAKQEFELGNKSYDSRDTKTALAHYDEAIRLAPSYKEAYLKKAGILLDIEKRDEAFQCIEVALKQSPDDAELLKWKCSMLYESGNLNEALKTADKAIEINPKSFAVHFYRSMTLHELGRDKEGLEEIDRCYKLDSKNGHILDGQKVKMFIEAGRYDDALIIAEDAISRDAKDYSGYIIKGDIFVSKGLYEEAVKSYSKAIENTPESSREFLYVINGECLLRLKKYDEAVTCLGKVIAKSTDARIDCTALYAMALIGRNENDDALKAKELMESQLKNHPDDMYALAVLGRDDETIASISRGAKENRFFKKNLPKILIFEKYSSNPEFQKILK